MDRFHQWRIEREVISAWRVSRDKDKVLEQFHDKYGADADWLSILEVVLRILSLVMPLVKQTNTGLTPIVDHWEAG